MFSKIVLCFFFSLAINSAISISVIKDQLKRENTDMQTSSKIVEKSVLKALDTSKMGKSAAIETVSAAVETKHEDLINGKKDMMNAESGEMESSSKIEEKYTVKETKVKKMGGSRDIPEVKNLLISPESSTLHPVHHPPLLGLHKEAVIQPIGNNHGAIINDKDEMKMIVEEDKRQSSSKATMENVINTADVINADASEVAANEAMLISPESSSLCSKIPNVENCNHEEIIKPSEYHHEKSNKNVEHHYEELIKPVSIHCEEHKFTEPYHEELKHKERHNDEIIKPVEHHHEEHIKPIVNQQEELIKSIEDRHEELVKPARYHHKDFIKSNDFHHEKYILPVGEHHHEELIKPSAHQHEKFIKNIADHHEKHNNPAGNHHEGWDEWSDWSACSSSCGDGSQHRWRYCLLQAGCQGFNKQTRPCNTFPCRGVVAPLSLEDKKYFHPGQWERVPGRETAWRLKPNSYLWLPAAELPFPNNYFRNHFALLLSLRIDPKKPVGGTLFSLRSRRQEECYFAVEVAGQDAIKLVHSGPNGTQSVLVPALLADGKWHRLALGIQDDSSVRSYFDCRWVSTDILKKNSLDIPEDADLVIGYLFSGELEDMVLVADPSGVAQQCSTNLTPALDPLLEAARPHRKPHRTKTYTKSWMSHIDQNQLITDDEDFEGSGATADYAAATEWTEWSACSSTCGLGVQHRKNLCVEDTCIKRKETRPCNSGPCFNRRRTNTDCHCENGGTCKKRGECHCKAGYSGSHCETPVCRPHCRNGGVCTQPGVCMCPSHFTGSICQTPICDPVCQNGGHCVGNNQCLCPPNTSGKYCQNYTCGAGCENGGTCVGPGLCECPHNATGELCQEPLCDPPCENSATCAPGNICICQPHSSGPRCHDKKCEYRPVQEPYVRGYRRLLLKKHFETKCDSRNWKSCIKTVPEYQNVYERAYRTTYKCIDQP